MCRPIAAAQRCCSRARCSACTARTYKSDGRRRERTKGSQRRPSFCWAKVRGFYSPCGALPAKLWTQIALDKSDPRAMVSFQKLFGANLSHVETQSMPVSMTVARKLRDWILGDDKLATFPTVVLLAFVALWKIEKACTSLLRVLLWPFKRSDPREEVLHFQRATGMGDNLAFAAIDLYIAEKLGYKKQHAMSKSSRQLAQPPPKWLSGGPG